MHITGRTSEENLTFLTMTLLICAKTGKRALSLANMKKGVVYKQHVHEVMAGRNKNFILIRIKQGLAKTRNVMDLVSVNSIMGNMIEDTLRTKRMQLHRDKEQPWNNRSQFLNKILLLTMLIILKNS